MRRTMAVFAYKAADSAQVEESGTITADSPRHARDLLRQRGLTVRRVEPLSEPEARRSPATLLRRGPARVEVTQFIRELATLLSVGLPLSEALETLSRQHEGRMKESILLLRERVLGGESLASAMKRQGRVFDELCLSITEVGEDAGTLDTSLERLAEFRERSDQLRGRIGTMLIYPAVVILVAASATIFLMTFVVPRIIQPLIEQGQPLPLPTKIVKGVSDFLLAWGWAIALAAIGAIAGFSAALRTPGGRRAFDGFILRMPLLGVLIRKQAMVRICVVLETLLRSGVVFLRALEIARRGVSNTLLRQALERCERAVGAGGDIGAAIEQTRAFEPMVVQVFALGQQSGKLEEMLGRLATTYDQQVQQSTQRLASLLEPAIIMVLAVVVLVIVLATVLPILEAGNVLQ